MDFAEARRHMVDGQVKPNRVTDPRILLAMQEVPRERFVPPALVARALSDEDLALGRGRVLLQPMVIARLLQTARPRPGDRVLVAASGTGYGAALLAHIVFRPGGPSVVAVEDDDGLLAIAAPAIEASGLPPGAIRPERGDPAAGHPAAGPFDVILIDGAVASIPAVLSDQLAEGGRVVAIHLVPGGAGTAVIGRRIGGTFGVQDAFDCRGTVLPAFARAPAFLFA